jgi:Mrp family chromosome partitioning ATPase
MSTTNRAIIKAYLHDDAQPQATGRAPKSLSENRQQRGGQAHFAPKTPQNEPVPDGSGIGSKTEPARAQAARVGAGEAAPPGPAANSGAIKTAPGRSVGASDSFGGEKRPLSSYIPRPQAGHSLRVDEAAPDQAFRAGTTVASFQWPEVCRALMQQCGPQLDQVARLLWARAGAGHSLLGVFGMFRGSGATTSALCLASRAASRGRRLVLGDGNFRNPSIAALLDAVPTAGWEEVLRHAAPVPEAVIHATVDQLDVLALGPKPAADPKPLVSGLQAAVTAGILRHAYELAIMDLGTFFDPESQPTLLELVANMGIDAAIAVAGPEPADRRDLATIAEQLDRSECELLGVIENRVVKPRAA